MTVTPHIPSHFKTGPRVAGSLLELAGDTPLLRLGTLAAQVRPTVYAKLEYFNPGGSVKDRPAFAMVEAAEHDGILRPGGTIVEATAGNTGAGLAIAAADKGYRCVFVVSDKVSPEKQNLLKAFGADVVVAPYNVAPTDPRSYYNVTDRLAAEIPGAVKLDQYRNVRNPGAHTASTGPEIWEQTQGGITHFVAGIGTGGTICGTAAYLKSRNPGITVVGVEPHGSIFSGGPARPYLVEGVGEDFWPDTFDPGLVDEIIQVSDAESFSAARTLARTQGALTGGSSGAAIAGALKLAARLDGSAVVVAILPDGGRGYLSRFYDDQWMVDHGFLRRDGHTVADALSTQPHRRILAVTPNDTVHQALSLTHGHGVSDILVAETVPPLLSGDISGVIDATELQTAPADAPAGSLSSLRPPEFTGAGELFSAAQERLQRAGQLVVLDEGKIAGLLTR